MLNWLFSSNPRIFWIASSIRICGTISPPIFEKRLSRPVIWMKPSVVDHGDVAGDVPAVADHLGRLFGLMQIALHHVGALHQQHAGRFERQVFERLGVDDLRGDAGTGRPTVPSLQSMFTLFDRLGGMLTDTSGESSVVP